MTKEEKEAWNLIRKFVKKEIDRAASITANEKEPTRIAANKAQRENWISTLDLTQESLRRLQKFDEVSIAQAEALAEAGFKDGRRD